MSAFVDGPAPSSPALAVAAFAVLVTVAAVLWALAEGSGPSALHTAARGGQDAVWGNRYELRPDGSLAACEVTLSIRDVEIVRRVVFAADGEVDPAASGLFRAGERERALIAVEIDDLRTVGRRGPDQLGKAFPESLTTER